MKIFIKKTVIIFLLFTLLIAMVYTSTTVKAFDDKFEDFDNSEEVEGVTSAVNDIGGTVMTILRIASATVAMVIILVIAMKYMLAAPGERADLKKHSIAYVIGAFILFGVTGIIGILVDFAGQINADGGSGSDT